MKLFILTVAIFIVAEVNSQVALEPIISINECPEFQVYNECGVVSSCEPTCEQLDGPLICPAMCVSGCFCQEGYVRDAKGNCIPKTSCSKPVCKKNEVYGPCGGSPCQATCENPDLPMMCKAPCSPGCGCREGFVRDANRNCVRPSQCPKPICKKNEVYKDCGPDTGCEPTCEQPQGPIFCTKRCRQGCFCRDGYVRDSNGKCIPVEKCKKKCGKNEIWSMCNKFCDRRCSHLVEPMRDCFMLGCNSGCICADGYYRDANNVCIPMRRCPEAQLEATPVKM